MRTSQQTPLVCEEEEEERRRKKRFRGLGVHCMQLADTGSAMQWPKLSSVTYAGRYTTYVLSSECICSCGMATDMLPALV